MIERLQFRPALSSLTNRGTKQKHLRNYSTWIANPSELRDIAAHTPVPPPGGGAFAVGFAEVHARRRRVEHGAPPAFDTSAQTP